MKILEHLYLYLWDDPRENNCNSIFIDGKTPVLIDPGHLDKVNMLFDRMKDDGIDPGRVKAVICTHGHPDHFEGTLAFGKTAAKIAISRREEQYIEQVGRPMYAQSGTAVPNFRVDFHLKEGDLQLGKLEFQVLETPGHSPGSICLYWPRQKVLISGDLVFSRGVGRVDLPGGDGAELRKSLHRVAGLKVELLIPGHGPAIPGSERVRSNFEFVRGTNLTL
ncbi:MAG: MBL fold metallo-hydrolase [Pseudomonadota bacterium]